MEQLAIEDLMKLTPEEAYDIDVYEFLRPVFCALCHENEVDNKGDFCSCCYLEGLEFAHNLEQN